MLAVLKHLFHTHTFSDMPVLPCALQAAKDVVLSEKPVIMDDTSSLEPLMLDKLLLQVGGWATAPPRSTANKPIEPPCACQHHSQTMYWIFS